MKYLLCYLKQAVNFPLSMNRDNTMLGVVWNSARDTLDFKIETSNSDHMKKFNV